MLDRLLLLGELPGHFTVGGKHKERKACILASAFPTRFLCGYLLGHSCIIPQPLLNHFVLRNTFSPLCSCRFPERFGSVQKRQAARGRVLPALQGGLTPRGHSAARLAALKNTRRYFVRCSYPCKNLRLWADAGEERCPDEKRWVLLGLLRAVPSRLLAPSGCSSPWHSALQCLLCLGAVEVCASRNAGAAPTSRSARFVVPHG